jgi:serine/threonine protein kinase
MAGRMIEIDQETKESLQSDKVVRPEEGIRINSKLYHPQEHVKSGTKGVVWEGRDEYNHPVAIKFTIYEDYENRSFLEEASRASKLKEYPSSFARFDNVGLVELDLLNGQRTKFVCFIEEWIDGWTLESYLEQHEIEGIFLRDYAKNMCEALIGISHINS